VMVMPSWSVPVSISVLTEALWSYVFLSICL
jgi:hypothetical protein